MRLPGYFASLRVSETKRGQWERGRSRVKKGDGERQRRNLNNKGEKDRGLYLERGRGRENGCEREVSESEREEGRVGFGRTSSSWTPQRARERQ